MSNNQTETISTVNPYHWTSESGLDIAQRLLSAHVQGKEINDEFVAAMAKRIVEKYGKSLVQLSTEGGAKSRIKRELARLTENKFVIPEAAVKTTSVLKVTKRTAAKSASAATSVG